MDDTLRIEIEAAVFRRLVDHFRHRTDVQNIDLRGLGGFCRNASRTGTRRRLMPEASK